MLRALECLARIWLITGEPVLAVEAAADAISLDPLRESSYRLLMQAHDTGNRPEALQVYSSLRKRLLDELGTNPSAESEKVYLALLE